MKRPTVLFFASLVLPSIALGLDGAPIPPANEECIDTAIEELQAVRQRLSLLLLEAPDAGGFAAADAGLELAAAAARLRGIGHSFASLAAGPGLAGTAASAGLSEIAEGAGDLARLVRGAPAAWSAAGLGPALEEVATAADQLLLPLGPRRAASSKKVIPMRFVEVSGCPPGTPACARYMDRAALVAAQDAMNESYAPAGLAFWVKAVDRYEMDHFASTTAPADTSVSWSTAKSELGRAIRVWDPDPLPANRTYQQWVDYVTTAFADPSELLVWLFDGESVVKRVHDKKSYGQFPQEGRAPVLTWSNVHMPQSWPDVSPNHVVHELGHYFGLGHTSAGPCCTHPVRQAPMDWADLWDLVWCPGDLGFPQSFGSREEALASGCASLQPIETTLCPCGTYDAQGDCTCPEPSCRVDNRHGSDDSAMVCTVGGEEYFSGESMLKGLSFATGEPENPPASPMTYWDDWSFAWGVNVMNYYSRFNAHLWDPGRFSASQIDLVRGHATNEVPILADYAPFTNLTSGRTKLGVDVKDYEWWSNGDFTFSRVISPILDDDRVPIAGDFDADGADDIFWYRPGTASDSIWWSNGDRTWQGASTAVNNVYTPVSGDFDGDGATDVIWYRAGTASDPVWWFLPRVRRHEEDSVRIDGSYLPVVGNFDGWAGDDIAWYNPLAGDVHFWWSHGDRTFYHQDHVPVGRDCTPFAGDFDGDGRTDIFWYRPGRARDTIWWSDGLSREFTADGRMEIQMTGWRTPVVGDFDGDGDDDIVWDRRMSIDDELWIGGGARDFVKDRFSVHDGFRAVVGRFDRDAASDVFWYHR